MTANKNLGGRPLKFRSVKVLQDAIDSYFDSCYVERHETDKDGNATGKIYKLNIRPLTITSLAVHLDTSRNTLMQYEGRKGFVNAINKAKARIGAWTEEQLYRSTQVAGVIFSLKNNYGWKDKKELELGTDPISGIQITLVKSDKDKGEDEA